MIRASRVLVVDDELAQREVLRYNLSAEGFEVETAENGDEALLLVSEFTPDVIILDWMMPFVSGIEVCRQIKFNPQTSEIAVILLSARSDEPDKIQGLNIGADDYVTKPYSVKEVVARVNALLRRTRPTTADKTLQFNDISLDPRQHNVQRAGRKIELGPLEYRLLATLMERPGIVWSRNQLLENIWGRDTDVETRTVDVHIGRLRKALCAHGGENPIRTVRGTGYTLAT